jgi:hypothetical protein
MYLQLFLPRRKNLFSLKSNEKLCRPVLKLIGQYTYRFIGLQVLVVKLLHMQLQCRGYLCVMSTPCYRSILSTYSTCKLVHMRLQCIS